jgi:hypothetical protein
MWGWRELSQMSTEQRLISNASVKPGGLFDLWLAGIYGGLLVMNN